ncbi:MAG: MBL fold metallo-hydrolase [Candidatus Hydrogenedentes bacterium]|nr:MBL fold metallo-hydrolase [Candidatus Hydrogenedentota bacterium]
MIVRHFLLDVHEANSFVVACEEDREAALVDAGAFDSAVDEFLHDEKLRLVKIFITHDHFDHTGGLPEYVKRFKAEVLCGLSEVAGCTATRVKHGDRVNVGRLIGTVLETPGHTPEGLSLAFPGHVFTGDALFAGSVGGTSSERDRLRQLDAIRKHIFTLPPQTEIHVGHGPSSTVAIESRFNPFFV